MFKLLTLLLYFGTCESKRYEGFKLLRGIPASKEHLEFFRNVTENYEVNVWQPPGLVNRPVDFIISPDHADIVKHEAKKLNISLVTLHRDIQSAFDNQTVNTYSRRDMKSFTWHSYYRYGDILNWMKDLRKQYPKEITLFSIGKTLENRNIMALKIVLKGCNNRSSVVIEGGIHAREWIGPAVVTYLINEVVKARNSQSNSEMRKIALNYVWYFVPVFNVDGYEYSHTTDRLWRKNRRGGYGVDLNRNFDAAFGTVGVTMTKKKSEEYCGPKPFSEPETQHMRDFVNSVDVELPLSHYLSFHAYGQLFIIPYAYTQKHLENFNEMKKIGDEANRRIQKRHGTTYTVGTAFDTVGYMAAGVSACWAKKRYRIRYVAVFELRDEGDHGFALPANQILDTCKETMDGLMEVLKPRTLTKLTELKDAPGGQSRILVNECTIIALTIFLLLKCVF